MKTVHLAVAVSAIAVTILAGVYAMAAGAAAKIGSAFSTEETSSHARIATFSTTLKQAAAEHRAAHAKCKLVAGAEKDACNAAVKAEDRRAFGALHL